MRVLLWRRDGEVQVVRAALRAAAAVRAARAELAAERAECAEHAERATGRARAADGAPLHPPDAHPATRSVPHLTA